MRPLRPLRPLYASLTNAELRLDGGNAGLWYDKYYDQWRPGWTFKDSDEEKTPKLSWIETVANGKSIGNQDLLAESLTRLHGLTVARSGCFGIFTTESHFVTGLGRSHPVENGFAWHPTLGIPYLPGSSIKGMVQAWARSEAEPRPTEDVLQKLFGPAQLPHAAGRVIFLDALPLVPVKLKADVMTPHYAGWTPEKPPGDWRDPVPVPFLVVAPENPFVFSLLPRGIEPRELDTVFAWLRDALLGAGAGAKTAVGYGRFAYDEARTAERKTALEKQRLALEQAARRAKLQGTPLGRWLAELEGKPERVLLELVRTHLENGQIADASERRAFALAIAETPYLARWRKGDKADKKSTSGGPGRLKELAQLVDKAATSKDEPDR